MWHRPKINRAADLLRQAQRVVAFTGAGISTPSGIPDFRSHEFGMWHHADPAEVASLSGFRRNPQAFYDWFHPLAKLSANAKPNAAHHAMVSLEAMGKMHSVVTQNIDQLHRQAGQKTVYEIHGHTRELACLTCFQRKPADEALQQFLQDGRAPRCDRCGNVVKPSVVLFGEALPSAEFEKARQAARNCDVMLVVGSSLEVRPAADIPLLALQHGAKIMIINKTPTQLDRRADCVISGDVADVLPQIVKRLES